MKSRGTRSRSGRPSKRSAGFALGCLALLGCHTSDAPEPAQRRDAGAQQDRGGELGRDASGPKQKPAPALDAGARVAGDSSVRPLGDAGDTRESGLPAYDGDPRRPEFCKRPGDDSVRDLFCRAPIPESGAQVDSLRALLALLRFHVEPLGAEWDKMAAQLDPNTLVTTAVFLGHSTALSGKLVSPINPRAILLGNDTLATFQRGVQQVELASLARDRSAFNFYLLSFTQACNEREQGCSPGDLYTPQVEADWTSVSVRDDEDLKNTQFDCRQCHQRAREIPVLLMRELQSPWTHFFDLAPEDIAFAPGPRVSGVDLVSDYLSAKGDEPYAGQPAFLLRHTVGLTLQTAVATEQPLLFDAPTIEEERWPYGENGYAEQEQRSATWDRAYAAFKRGEQLPMPHFSPRPTDPRKQAKLSEAYRRFARGEISREELPDLADIFPDDPKVRAEIGLQTEPDATPAEALIQACGSCHNDVLDQTISRARFNIDLTRMSRAELDLAIERLQLEPHAAGVMPPPEARQLDAEGKRRLIAYLAQDERTAEDDALLTRAAQLGMVGTPSTGRGAIFGTR